MFLLLVGCVKQWLFAQLPQPLAPEASPPAGLVGLSAETCAACHVEIAAEWRASRMSRAWTDPVFQADWAANGRLYACLYCHTPMVEQRDERVTGLASLRPLRGAGEPNPTFDASLREEGVTCVACHLAGEAIAGPHGLAAPHATVRVEGFAGAERCVGCHQVDGPPLSRLRRPIADTHGEWEGWRAATGRSETCTDCHMEAVERPLVAGGPARPGRRHTFHGAWSDAMVRAGVEVRAEAGAVVLVNLAGHNTPTADPARAVEVTGTWPDGTERTTWIERVVALPEMVERSDTTLRPGETRAVALPGATRARVVFHRLRNLPELRAHADAPTEVTLWEGSLP
ncbi:MAG: hypothetical protein ACOZNI_28210 [Myxococcota bacterium]